MISQNEYAKAVPPLGAEHHQKTIQAFVKDFLQEGSPSIMIEVRRSMQSVYFLFRTAWLQCALCYCFIRSTYFQTVGSRTAARAIFNKSPGMKGYIPKSRTGLSQPMKLPSQIKPDV